MLTELSPVSYQSSAERSHTAIDIRPANLTSPVRRVVNSPISSLPPNFLPFFSYLTQQERINMTLTSKTFHTSAESNPVWEAAYKTDFNSLYKSALETNRNKLPISWKDDYRKEFEHRKQNREIFESRSRMAAIRTRMAGIRRVTAERERTLETRARQNFIPIIKLNFLLKTLAYVTIPTYYGIKCENDLNECINDGSKKDQEAIFFISIIGSGILVLSQTILSIGKYKHYRWSQDPNSEEVISTRCLNFAQISISLITMGVGAYLNSKNFYKNPVSSPIGISPVGILFLVGGVVEAVSYEQFYRVIKKLHC